MEVLNTKAKSVDGEATVVEIKTRMLLYGLMKKQCPFPMI